mmetsp:Transcript_40927/g.107469  ORF Transcript_40927/g.107469 Transcript_40927/m.107469 type:complete len:309 (-) Transcript_40927:581-1507(-)
MSCSVELSLGLLPLLLALQLRQFLFNMLDLGLQVLRDNLGRPRLARPSLRRSLCQPPNHTWLHRPRALARGRRGPSGCRRRSARTDPGGGRGPARCRRLRRRIRRDFGGPQRLGRFPRGQLGKVGSWPQAELRGWTLGEHWLAWLPRRGPGLGAGGGRGLLRRRFAGVRAWGRLGGDGRGGQRGFPGLGTVRGGLVRPWLGGRGRPGLGARSRCRRWRRWRRRAGVGSWVACVRCRWLRGGGVVGCFRWCRILALRDEHMCPLQRLVGSFNRIQRVLESRLSRGLLLLGQHLQRHCISFSQLRQTSNQ